MPRGPGQSPRARQLSALSVSAPAVAAAAVRRASQLQKAVVLAVAVARSPFLTFVPRILAQPRLSQSGPGGPGEQAALPVPERTGRREVMAASPPWAPKPRPAVAAGVGAVLPLVL